jgi:hypothetical protein
MCFFFDRTNKNRPSAASARRTNPLTTLPAMMARWEAFNVAASRGIWVGRAGLEDVGEEGLAVGEGGMSEGKTGESDDVGSALVVLVLVLVLVANEVVKVVR